MSCDTFDHLQICGWESQVKHHGLVVAALALTSGGWYALSCVAAAEKKATAPLVNPIPAKIDKGDIIVEAIAFVRAPKTVDPHQRPITLAGIDAPLGSSSAYARIQSL